MGKKGQSARANIFSLEKQKGSKFYSIRIMYMGKRRRFSTGETSQKGAKLKARLIMADIQSRGFEEAVKIHARRQTSVQADPSISEFTDLYRSVSSKFDPSPSQPTRERYIRSLERIAESIGAKMVSQITPDRIDEFKAQYLSDKVRPRLESSAKTSLNGILRNAAALFSRQSLSFYRKEGLELENPFLGSQLKRVVLKSYSPLPRDLLSKIWGQSDLLLEGDPEADPPLEGLRARDTFDFRFPQPYAYQILLLELGLGLRRNEADKAEWQWFFQDNDGRRFVEIKETPFFVPKSKQSRVIPVEEGLWEALSTAKSNDRFVVGGNDPVPLSRSETKSIVYRCDRAHRHLVAWLKMMGVDDPKPCHRLRKEFGSYISTHFGLFYAQRFLGHSSPKVTSDYYAGLTDLPTITPSKMANNNER